MPQMGVADEGDTQCVLALAMRSDFRDLMRVNFRLTVEVHVVGMRLENIIARHQHTCYQYEVRFLHIG